MSTGSGARGTRSTSWAFFGSGRRTSKGTGAAPVLSSAVSVIARATSTSSIGWLKRSSIFARGSAASSGPGSVLIDSRRGRAVANRRTYGFSIASPPSDRVPAGTSTVSSVARGRCPSGMNVTPVVPTQIQWPGTWGLRTTGGRVSCPASSSGRIARFHTRVISLGSTVWPFGVAKTTPKGPSGRPREASPSPGASVPRGATSGARAPWRQAATSAAPKRARGQGEGRGRTWLGRDLHREGAEGARGERPMGPEVVPRGQSSGPGSPDLISIPDALTNGHLAPATPDLAAPLPCRRFPR